MTRAGSGDLTGIELVGTAIRPFVKQQISTQEKNMTKALRLLALVAVAATPLLVSLPSVGAQQAEDPHHAQSGTAGDAPATQAGSSEQSSAAMPEGKGGMMGAGQMPMMGMMRQMHEMMMGGMSMQPKGDRSPSSQAFNGTMAKMHEDMAITYTGNADVDFVKAMIAHHQGAIDMAKTALAFGKDPEVAKVAEGIVKAQEAEIAWMQEWLKKQAP